MSYRWQSGAQTLEPGPVEDGINCTQATTKAGKRTHIGFLAQDVRAATPNELDWAAWTLADPTDPESQQGLRYEQFIGPLVLAIQELTQRLAQIESLIDPPVVQIS